jgi:UDP-glucose 4-epimerase
MKALVTGANGFLGRHLVAALLKRGVQVRALVRPATNVEALGWPEAVEIFRADLRTASNLDEAFDGVDVLEHLAAVVAGGDDLRLAASAGGTERLLNAMAATSCKRIVLASTFSVYDRHAVHGKLDESAPVLSGPSLYELDGYTVAKAWQERVTRRMAEQHGWDLTVLRPGFIWGKDNAEVAALGIKAGKLRFVIGPLSRMPLTHVENCADLFALAAVNPRARGETFNVVDDQGVRIWPFLTTHLKRMGEHEVRVPVPYQLAYGVLRLAKATVFRNSTKLPVSLIPGCFEARLKSFEFSNQKARDLLDWQPPLDLEECVARSY